MHKVPRQDFLIFVIIKFFFQVSLLKAKLSAIESGGVGGWGGFLGGEGVVGFGVWGGFSFYSAWLNTPVESSLAC